LSTKIAAVTKEKETDIGSTLYGGTTNRVLPSPKMNNQPIQLLNLRARKYSAICDRVPDGVLADTLLSIIQSPFWLQGNFNQVLNHALERETLLLVGWLVGWIKI
jgi:hypothetical protein